MPSNQVWRTKNKERINRQRRLARAVANQLAVKEQQDRELAALSKISVDGKKICLYDGCGTILSRYNEDPCCAQHQKDWFAANKDIMKEIVLDV